MPLQPNKFTKVMSEVARQKLWHVKLEKGVIDPDRRPSIR